MLNIYSIKMKNKIKNKWKVFWMMSTIGVGTYVIMYGEKIIPNWFKPKLGTVNINKKEIKKELPVIDKVIIDKYENVR